MNQYFCLNCKVIETNDIPLSRSGLCFNCECVDAGLPHLFDPQIFTAPKLSWVKA